MSNWKFLKQPEFWITLIISITLTFAGTFFSGISYKDSIVNSPNAELNKGTKIEGDFSQQNSIANFGQGVTTIGNVQIGTNEEGSFIALGGGDTYDYVAIQNSGKTWRNVLFTTPNCDLGLIKELPSNINLTVAKCSTKNSCKILPQYQLLRNSMWLNDASNKTVFVGTYFENFIPIAGIERCFNNSK